MALATLDTEKFRHMTCSSSFSDAHPGPRIGIPTPRSLTDPHECLPGWALPADTGGKWQLMTNVLQVFLFSMLCGGQANLSALSS